MVIVSSIALATMITNDLVMPVLWRSRWLKPTETRDIGRMVLWLRRVSILLLALLAYAYHRNTVDAGEPRFDRPARVRRGGAVRAAHPGRPLLATRDPHSGFLGPRDGLRALDVHAAAAELQPRRPVGRGQPRRTASLATPVRMVRARPHESRSPAEHCSRWAATSWCSSGSRFWVASRCASAWLPRSSCARPCPRRRRQPVERKSRRRAGDRRTHRR